MTNGMKFIDVFHPARVIYDEKSDTTIIQLKGDWWDKEYCDPEDETVTGFADRCRECGAKYGKLLKQVLKTEQAEHKAHDNLYNKGFRDGLAVLDKIRAEIDRQQKWLLHAGYTAYNVDIALDAIKSVVVESEE